MWRKNLQLVSVKGHFANGFKNSFRRWRRWMKVEELRGSSENRFDVVMWENGEYVTRISIDCYISCNNILPLICRTFSPPFHQFSETRKSIEIIAYLDCFSSIQTFTLAFFHSIFYMSCVSQASKKTIQLISFLLFSIYFIYFEVLNAFSYYHLHLLAKRWKSTIQFMPSVNRFENFKFITKIFILYIISIRKASSREENLLMKGNFHLVILFL